MHPSCEVLVERFAQRLTDRINRDRSLMNSLDTNDPYWAGCNDAYKRALKDIQEVKDALEGN